MRTKTSQTHPPKDVKKLRNWTRDLGIAAKAFLRSGGTRRPRGAEGVVLCLWGDGERLRSFSMKLRTEHVDVDGRGKKCKEKQSKVLLARGTAKAAEASSSTSAWVQRSAGTLEEQEYGTRGELSAMLREALAAEDAREVEALLA